MLLALFGSYLAAKIFGILLLDFNGAGQPSPTAKDNHASPSADEYSDDTWDYRAKDRYEDEYIYEGDEPTTGSMTIGMIGTRAMMTIISDEWNSNAIIS